MVNNTALLQLGSDKMLKHPCIEKPLLRRMPGSKPRLHVHHHGQLLPQTITMRAFPLCILPKFVNARMQHACECTLANMYGCICQHVFHDYNKSGKTCAYNTLTYTYFTIGTTWLHHCTRNNDT